MLMVTFVMQGRSLREIDDFSPIGGIHAHEIIVDVTVTFPLLIARIGAF